MTGIIYLVQPCELIGTNRYKIGMSEKNNFSRLKFYKAGSRYISIFESENCAYVERRLLYEFNNKFKKIAGREYFSGDENEIITTFVTTVLRHNYNITMFNNDIDTCVKNLDKLHIDTKKKYIKTNSNNWMEKYKFK